MSTTRGEQLIGFTLGSVVLEKLIGYGGSSAVYLASETTSEEQVAVKVFLPRSSMGTKMRKDFFSRFLHEAQVASELDHPNILPIYSYDELEGLPYIVMPYMSGGTLSQYVAQCGCLSLNETRSMLQEIASAIDYIHQQGYVHCDIKPANILLDEGKHLCLSDFGISRLQQPEPADGQAEANVPDALMGTPDYISPEQALGQPVDSRSDIYSLGITIFFVLTGNLPFKADSTLSMALMQVHEPPPSLCLLRADIPPSVDRVIQKALAKQPDQRYATAGEFSAAFAHAIDEADESDTTVKRASNPVSNANQARAVVTIKPVQPEKNRLPRTSRLRRLLLIAALLVIITGGSVLAAGLINSYNAGPANDQSTPPLGSNGSRLVDILSYSNQWPTNSTLFFTNQQYHILNKSTQDVALAIYANHTYTDFRLMVNMSEIHGSHSGADYYGVVFRASSDQSHYYLFEVATGGGGQYAFWRFDGQWKSLASGLAPQLQSGFGKNNTITIEARGKTFTFSVNGKVVGSPISDLSKTPLNAGLIGLYVEEQGTEIAFSHLYIDPLS